MFNNKQLSNLPSKFLTAVLILAVFFGSIANPTSAHALGTTITVNTSLDTIATDSKCTLREAIVNANADAQMHSDCLAGSGNDTIDFANSLGVATIILGSTLPNISDADGLTIDGGGVITISGNNLYRVFFVNSAIPFTLNSLIISNAKATSSSGSVIYSNAGGPITISNSRLLNNTEGAISVSNASLTVMNSNFSGNSGTYGGGIYSSGILNVSNSIFAGNSSSSGSGGSAVYVAGTASITNSVFNINIQPGGRGSVFNAGTLTITNSTFFGNTSSLGNEVGAVFNQGALTITNSTFSGNSTSGSGGSGDIYQLGATSTLKLYNNILANSTGGGNCNFSDGGTVSGNNNLIEDAATACGFTNGVNGNIIGSDPALGVLADNGGPTHTFALSLNSPALDAGTNTGCPSTDQRGVARPQNGTCDMGAFESNAQPGPALIVNANNDLTDGFCDAYLAGVTDCTLREAIDYANSVSGTNTITFAANYTITLGSQLPVVTDTTIINGKGAANTLIQASTCNPVTLPGGCTPATYRVFQVLSTGNLTLDKLTVSNGQCAGACATLTAAGGGAYNAGTLTVANSTFSGNFTSHYGGGIANEGTLTVTNSIFSGNSAIGTEGGGGGVYSNGSTMTITNSTFSDNFANKFGGGAFNDVGTLTMSNSTFSVNSSRYGGGIYNSNGAIVIITNSTISENTSPIANAGGGGAYNYGTMTVTGSTFSGNSAEYAGGGVYNAGVLTVTRSTFSGNITNSVGGGIYAGAGTLTVTNSTFSGNIAQSGAGISIGSSQPTNVINTTISGNTATQVSGVGGIGLGASTLNLKNTIIANSLGGKDCGNSGGSINATNSLIESTTVINNCVLTTGVNGNIFGSDPNLGLLTGSPAYLPLLAGSPAIDAGHDGTCSVAPVSNTSQNGVTRPSGSHCDIGAYEYTEITVPTVLSVIRAGTSPSAATNVDFTITFSENVTGVTVSDFKITNTILTGASITNVSGADNIYTVTVNTGTGNGTIRLDVLATANIQGLTNAFVGPYTGGETYTISKGTAPTVPVLNLPADKALITGYTPTLDWDDSSQVLALTVPGWHYEIQVTSPVGYNQTFNTVDNINPLTGLGASQYIVTVPLLANTTFTWKVRAYNNANQYSAWSEARTFRTMLATPVLSLPADMTVLDNKHPSFDWNEVTGATSYNFQVLKDNVVVVTGTITAPLHGYTPALDLLPNTTYTWKVRANGTNAGIYSLPFTFTTSANPPKVPVLTLPVNAALVDGTLVQTLKWNPALAVTTANAATSYPIAASFQVEYATNSEFTNSTIISVNGNSIADTQLFLPIGSLLPNLTYYWRVRSWSVVNANGNHSAWSTVRTFRTKPPSTALAVPVLNLPTDGTTDSSKRPIFDWGNVSGASSYTLQILKGSTVVVTATVKAPLHTYASTVDLLPGTTYIWKVKANGLIPSDYSTPFTFATSPNAPKVPVLLAPAVNALVDSSVLQTLDWNPVLAESGTAYPAAVSYDVEYAANSTFASGTLANVAAPETQYLITNLLPAGTTFYWRVRSYNITGQYSAWSAVRIFKTRLAAPVLNLPTDLETLNNKRPTFEWDEVPGAASYTIQILKGSAVVITSSVSAPAYTYTPAADLLPDTTYTWKVKANGVDAGLYSAPNTFTTSANPPATPILFTPANGSLLPDALAQTLAWKPGINAPLSYEVEYANNSTFTGDTFVSNIVLAPATQLSITTLPGRTYYWRVRAWSTTDTSGIHSAWSTVWAIKVKFTPPVLDSVTITDGSPTFVWHSDNGLWTNYTLLILNPATKKVVKSFTVIAPTTFYTIPAASLPAGTYIWQVKINGLYTPVSSAISFDTFTR